jgi:hypothetical protein
MGSWIISPKCLHSTWQTERELEGRVMAAFMLKRYPIDELEATHFRFSVVLWEFGFAGGILEAVAHQMLPQKSDCNIKSWTEAFESLVKIHASDQEIEEIVFTTGCIGVACIKDINRICEAPATGARSTEFTFFFFLL